MLVSLRHPQVFVAQQLRYGVDVPVLHTRVARSCVAKIVEPKIQNLQFYAETLEGDADLMRRDVCENKIGRLSTGYLLRLHDGEPY